MSIKKILSAVLALALLITVMPLNVFADTQQTTVADANKNSVFDRENKYISYIGKYGEKPKIYDSVTIKPNSFAASSGSVEKGTFEGNSSAVKISSGGFAEWSSDIAKEGLYNIELTYYAPQGKMIDPEIGVQIDGSLPFNESGYISLQRIWEDSKDKPIETGNQWPQANGNDLRPEQIQVIHWQTLYLHDIDGLTDADYLYYLTSGNHKIKITVNSEEIVIGNINLVAKKPLINYDSLLAEYNKKGYTDASKDAFVEIPAEKAFEKSKAELYPRADYASSSTKPNSPAKIRLNTIGGENWKFPGEKITWKFVAPEDGLYTISLKYRQNFVTGINVHRRVYIDGVVPCSEMEDVLFPYTTDWKNKTITQSNGKDPLKIYLTKGEHLITMDVSFGGITSSLNVIEQTVYSMNEEYRKILTITGVSPDMFRDYNLDKEIPDLLETFKQISDNLKNGAAELEKINGVKGSEISLFYEVARQLDDLIKRPDTIPSRISEYEGNSSALANLMLRLKEQPLQMDYIMVSSASQKLPAADDNIFEAAAFMFQQFIMSFFEDYNAVGNVYKVLNGKKPLNVWVSANDLVLSGVSSGRDQMQILKSMIDDDFVQNTDIPVNLNLVDSSSTLTQAIVGGRGPDVALIVPKGIPVNLAMRGALQDLSKFEGFDEIKNEFFPSAFVPYKYLDGVYAMPETQGFMMMFYRTDIFAQLGIEAPNTWDDFYKILPKIQKKNMNIGLAENLMMFETYVLQSGGNYFNSDLSATGFDEPKTIDAFKIWTELYTKYSLPPYFNAYDRFRTGEIPLQLQGYGFYNQLTVAAPELKNLWDMVPVPGTLQPDGTINRKESAYGTGAIMLADAKNKDDAFTFMKWWVGSKAQAKFGNELEAMMGPAARYNTANKIAFEQLPWQPKEQEKIMNQWEQVWDIPQVPGTYMIQRDITNAWRRVVYYYENPRETILRYNNDINKEITRKRIEFGIEK